MKVIYSTEKCFEYMVKSKNLLIKSEEDKKIFLNILRMHGVNNVITVYKHYFCTDKNNDEHIYDCEIDIMKYKEKLDEDIENTAFMWSQIILIERLLKNEIYEQYIKEISQENNLKSEDIYKYLKELCHLKVDNVKEQNESYYRDIENLIEKSENLNKEFYFFIKELKWSNMITLILLLNKNRRNDLYTKFGINFEDLNKFRILRNSLAHGDYLTIYLNKQIYDLEKYDKLEVINKILKILKKNYTYSVEEIYSISEFYRKQKSNFEVRSKYI